MIPGNQQQAIVPQAVLMAAASAAYFCGTVQGNFVYEWIRDNLGHRYNYGVALVLALVLFGLSFHRARNVPAKLKDDEDNDADD